MPENTPPTLRETASTAPNSMWHDLVCAVVAGRGSPRLRASSRLRSKIERELGLPSSSASRQGRLWMGLAAAAAFALMIARPGNPSAGKGPDDPPKAAWNASRAMDIEHPDALATFPATSGGESPAEPSGAAAANIHPAAAVLRAGHPESPPTAIKQDPTFAEAPNTPLADDAILAIQGGGGGHATAKEILRDDLSHRSDYYVAGLAAAAFRLPIDTNPYEQKTQAIAWADWMAGHEMGMEMTPEEVLAISEVRAVLAADPVIAAGAPLAAIVDPDAILKPQPVSSAPQAQPAGATQADMPAIYPENHD